MTAISFRLTSSAATLAVVALSAPALASLSLEPDAADTGVLSPEAAVLFGALQEEVAAEAPVASPWTSKVNAGGSASFGNTDKQDAFAIFTTQREQADQKTSIRAGYYYGATDGDRSDNKFEASLRNDWYLNDSPWSIFAQAEYKYDEFQSWEHRVTGFVGAGYQFVKEDDFEFSGRVGLGGAQEFNSPNDDFRFEAVIGADLRWDMTEKTELTASTEIFPSLSDGGEFRTLSRVGVATLLDEELNMSFTAGLEHEHQSENVAPSEKDDFRVLFGLQFEF